MSKEVKRWKRNQLEYMHPDHEVVDAKCYDALLAERDRMAAENERLARDAKNDSIAYRAVIERQEELRAEIEALLKAVGGKGATKQERS
jgi:hypothetical protein